MKNVKGKTTLRAKIILPELSAYEQLTIGGGFNTKTFPGESPGFVAACCLFTAVVVLTGWSLINKFCPCGERKSYQNGLNLNKNKLLEQKAAEPRGMPSGSQIEKVDLIDNITYFNEEKIDQATEKLVHMLQESNESVPEIRKGLQTSQIPFGSPNQNVLEERDDLIEYFPETTLEEALSEKK